MENFSKVDSDLQKNEKQLQSILYILSTTVEDFSNEIYKSSELLKIGEKTELSKSIEKLIEDPLENLINTSQKVSFQINSIIDRVFFGFLKDNKQIINKAYKNQINSNELTYSIVLIDDTFENRNRIFKFYDFLYAFEASEAFPVTIQITPIELVDKLINKKEIDLNN
jgi:hypothetical protein